MTHEGKPMIENSDRGITLSKPLAWTMLVSLVSIVWFGSNTIAGLSNATQAVNSTLTVVQTSTSQIEGRVRALENSNAAGIARYDALAQALNEVKDQQRETNGMLRQILQAAKP